MFAMQQEVLRHLRPDCASEKVQSFGGHHILTRLSTRVRRLPVRFRAPDVELETDEAAGAHGIKYDTDESDCDSSTDVNCNTSTEEIDESENEVNVFGICLWDFRVAKGAAPNA